MVKTIRLRGQAWIVFAEIASATRAVAAMQGFPFFDKPLVNSLCIQKWSSAGLTSLLPCTAQHISYAKGKSDAIRKLEPGFSVNEFEKERKQRKQENGKKTGRFVRLSPKHLSDTLLLTPTHPPQRTSCTASRQRRPQRQPHQRPRSPAPLLPPGCAVLCVAICSH